MAGFCSRYRFFASGARLALSGLALLCAGSAWAGDVLYPPDAGVINVKTAYGANGDGVTDDTAAILSAIQHNVGSTGFGILYFPSGTYIVSQRLPYLDANGGWGAYLTLQGQNEANTVIKLADNAPGFQDAAHPVAVIYTASNNGNDNPADTANYNPDGGGNQGFRNHILNLTVDVGSHNPGAIGIDYMANNNTRISDVTVRSEDGAGVWGINIQRGLPGPMYLKNVQIQGFNTAIAVANSYGVWMEHLTLSGQKVSGVDVINGSAAMRSVTSTNTVPAVRVPNSAGVAVVTDANLTGGAAGTSAIQVATASTVFLRNITTAGYQSALVFAGNVTPGTAITEWTTAGATSLFGSAAPVSLQLPVSETPEYADTDFSHWGNVVNFGAHPDMSAAPVSFVDSADAIQAAIDSGYSTVYLPPGNYAISHTIHVRGAVQRLLGLSAYLIPLSASFPLNQPAIQVDTTNAPVVFVDGVGLDANYWVTGLDGTPGVVFPENNFVNNAASTLVLTNVDYFGYSNTPVSYNRTVYLESVYGISAMSFAHQTVFARNLDPENVDMSPHVLVTGGSMWTLGLKTEGVLSSVVVNQDGARSEFAGVAAGVFVDVPGTIPMAVNREASLALESFRSNPFLEPGGASDYDVLLEETLGGVTKFLYRAGSAQTPRAPAYSYGSADSLVVDSELTPFADIAPTAGYAPMVSELYFRGVTSGCLAAPLSFCPANPVTRREMAIFVVRGILGGDPAPGTYTSTPYFTDVPTSDYGFPWIQKLYEWGITGGCGVALFCPGDSVTRAQMAVFLIRARYGATTAFSYPATPYFTDVGPAVFGFSWIQRLREDNITSGCTATTYCPDDPVTRGDAAPLILRALSNLFLPASMPLIGSLSQTTIGGGATATLTVSGVGTHFVQGSTVVHSVAGLTAGAVTVLSPTTLTVTVTAAPGGSQPVSIWESTGAEDAVLPNGLVIQ